MSLLKAARCDDVHRLSSLALDSASRRVAVFGETRAEFQEKILNALRAEAEAETSLASLTSHRSVSDKKYIAFPRGSSSLFKKTLYEREFPHFLLQLTRM